MPSKRKLAFAGALVAALIFAGSAFASGYWFFNGQLSGAVFNFPQDGSTDYARESFDNTNHPGHEQKITLIDQGGTWHEIGLSCPVGQSGCDSGDLTLSSSIYPKGGCQVPGSYGYSVWTNCKYNNLHP